jgi:sugar phosphate isomerase/epimerase
MSFQTRTGKFPIGFRLMGNKDVAAVCQWMKGEGFGVLDLTANPPEDIAILKKHGIALGTIDLHEWADFPSMLASDKGRRDAAVAKAMRRIHECAELGAKKFFTVMLTAEEGKPPQETFGYMVESYLRLKDTLEQTKTQISIEGWPAYMAHCCNPESYREFFKEMNSPAFGINYDPSHLIRLGIDHVRFLREFAPQVVHVHGKDTEIMPEKLYELGWETNLARLSGQPWRYTLPGHGEARWPVLFKILEEHKYAGAICIEHEDDVFSGTPELEKEGLIIGARFLATC